MYSELLMVYIFISCISSFNPLVVTAKSKLHCDLSDVD